METVRLIVKNLVYLVLLAAFLEMLLPLKGSRRYIQVVLGLFILALILNPVVALFRQAPLLNLDLSREAEEGRGEVRSILAQGEELRQAAVEQARAASIKRLEEQVAVLARLVPGVEEAEVRVEPGPPSSLQSPEAIARIHVKIRVGQKGKGGELPAPVEKIRIGKGAGQEAQSVRSSRVLSEEERKLLSRVQETVASLFGLRPEQVVVHLESRG
ncbi:MAG: stage III sporulation protein AF [Firmicutes bacterium]|nr:stage III sporulation protein AF [Bacillota bacterium]